MALGSGNIQIDVSTRVDTAGMVRQVEAAERQIRPINLSLDDRKFRQPLGRITGDLGEFNKSLEASVARTLAFGAAVGVLNSVASAFKGMIASAADVERKLMDINVILNLNSQALEKFSSNLFQVAKNTGQAFDTVSDAAIELSRQGLGAQETLTRINDAMILTRLSGMDAAKSVESLTAALNGFSSAALNTTQIVNKLASVDAAFAVSTEDLANALARAGSTAQGAKVSFDELLAAVTSVQQLTARGGSVIGNAFKSIFTRIQRSGVREALEGIGVATTDAAGNIRGALSILKDYAGVYQTLSDQQRAYTDELIAGVFQINNLKALIKDLGSSYSIYDRALTQSSGATNEATKRNEQLQKTLSTLMNEAALNVKELAATLGDLVATPAIKNLLNMFNNIAGALAKALDPEKGNKLIKGLFGTIGRFLSGPGLVIITIAFVKLFKFITTQGVGAMKEVFNLGKAKDKIADTEMKLSHILKDNQKLYQEITSEVITQEQREKKVLEVIDEQNKAYERQRQIINSLASNSSIQSALPSSGGAAKGFIPNYANGLQGAIDSEQQAISSGVGGASKQAKPKVLKNFPVGKGKKETVVANTDEVIVPNYKGGQGSAIFNQDMIEKTGGKPNGAIPVARGYVPNFARKGSELNANKKKPADAFMSSDIWQNTINDWRPLSLDMVSSLGGIGMISAKGKNGTIDKGAMNPFGSDKLGPKVGKKIISEISGSNLNEASRNVVLSRISKLGTGKLGVKYENIGSSTFSELGKASDKDFSGVKGSIDSVIGPYIANATGAVAQKIYGNLFGDEVKANNLVKDVWSKADKSKIVDVDAEGSIFEAAVRLGSEASAKTFGTNSGQGNWDFEENANISSDLKNIFFDKVGYPTIQRADAKRVGSANSATEVLNKAYKSDVFNARLEDIHKEQYTPLVKAAVSGQKNAAGGFIPNYAEKADPELIKERVMTIAKYVNEMANSGSGNYLPWGKNPDVVDNSGILKSMDRKAALQFFSHSKVQGAPYQKNFKKVLGDDFGTYFKNATNLTQKNMLTNIGRAVNEIAKNPPDEKLSESKLNELVSKKVGTSIGGKSIVAKATRDYLKPGSDKSKEFENVLGSKAAKVAMDNREALTLRRDEASPDLDKHFKIGDAFEEVLSILGGVPFEKNSDALDFSRAKGRKLSVAKAIREKIGLDNNMGYGDAHKGSGHTEVHMAAKIIKDLSMSRGSLARATGFNKGAIDLYTQKNIKDHPFPDITKGGADSSQLLSGTLSQVWKKSKFESAKGPLDNLIKKKYGKTYDQLAAGDKEDKENFKKVQKMPFDFNYVTDKVDLENLDLHGNSKAMKKIREIAGLEEQISSRASGFIPSFAKLKWSIGEGALGKKTYGISGSDSNLRGFGQFLEDKGVDPRAIAKYKQRLKEMEAGVSEQYKKAQDTEIGTGRKGAQYYRGFAGVGSQEQISTDGLFIKGLGDLIKEFNQDPFYAKGFVPSFAQRDVDRLSTERGGFWSPSDLNDQFPDPTEGSGNRQIDHFEKASYGRGNGKLDLRSFFPKSGTLAIGTLFKDVIAMANAGTPYKTVDAGEIVGPRIPKMLVTAKKFLDKKRRSGLKQPPMDINGYFEPYELFNSLKRNKNWYEAEKDEIEKSGKKFKPSDPGRGIAKSPLSQKYVPEEEKALMGSFRDLGLPVNVKDQRGGFREYDRYYLKNLPLFQGGFAGGFVPNMAEEGQLEGVGKYSEVYDKESYSGRTLDIGYLSSGDGSGRQMFKTLLDLVTNAAQEGKPFTDIDAGSVVGPRIPSVLVKAKKLLDRVRAKGRDIPFMKVDGFMNPPAALSEKLSGKKDQQKQFGTGAIGRHEYKSGDEKELANALRQLGINPESEKMVMFSEVPMLQQFARGFIPNFAGMDLYRGVKRDKGGKYTKEDVFELAPNRQKQFRSSDIYDIETLKQYLLGHVDNQQASSLVSTSTREGRAREFATTKDPSKQGLLSKKNMSFKRMYNPRKVEKLINFMMERKGWSEAKAVQWFLENGKNKDIGFHMKRWMDEGSNLESQYAFEDEVALLGKSAFSETDNLAIASRGLIPNFANALEDAMAREKEALKSQGSNAEIYVDKDDRVKGPENPMGLLVANKRDEPRSGSQGVNRVLANKMDPKTHGAFGGFIPNYADGGDGGGKGFLSKMAGSMSSMWNGLVKAWQDHTKDFTPMMKDTFTFFTQQWGSALDQFKTDVFSGGVKPFFLSFTDLLKNGFASTFNTISGFIADDMDILVKGGRGAEDTGEGATTAQTHRRDLSTEHGREYYQNPTRDVSAKQMDFSDSARTDSNSDSGSGQLESVATRFEELLSEVMSNFKKEESDDDSGPNEGLEQVRDTAYETADNLTELANQAQAATQALQTGSESTAPSSSEPNQAPTPSGGGGGTPPPLDPTDLLTQYNEAIDFINENFDNKEISTEGIKDMARKAKEIHEQLKQTEGIDASKMKEVKSEVKEELKKGPKSRDESLKIQQEAIESKKALNEESAKVDQKGIDNAKKANKEKKSAEEEEINAREKAVAKYNKLVERTEKAAKDFDVDPDKVADEVLELERELKKLQDLGINTDSAMKSGAIKNIDLGDKEDKVKESLGKKDGASAVNLIDKSKEAQEALDEQAKATEKANRASEGFGMSMFALQMGIQAAETAVRQLFPSLEEFSLRGTQAGMAAADLAGDGLQKLGDTFPQIAGKLGPWGKAIQGVIIAVGVASDIFEEFFDAEKLAIKALEKDITKRKEEMDIISQNVEKIDKFSDTLAKLGDATKAGKMEEAGSFIQTLLEDGRDLVSLDPEGFQKLIDTMGDSKAFGEAAKEFKKAAEQGKAVKQFGMDLSEAAKMAFTEIEDNELIFDFQNPFGDIDMSEVEEKMTQMGINVVQNLPDDEVGKFSDEMARLQGEGLGSAEIMKRMPGLFGEISGATRKFIDEQGNSASKTVEAAAAQLKYREAVVKAKEAFQNVAAQMDPVSAKIKALGEAISALGVNTQKSFDVLQSVGQIQATSRVDAATRTGSVSEVDRLQGQAAADQVNSDANVAQQMKTALAGFAGANLTSQASGQNVLSDDLKASLQKIQSGGVSPEDSMREIAKILETPDTEENQELKDSARGTLETLQGIHQDQVKGDAERRAQLDANLQALDTQQKEFLRNNVISEDILDSFGVLTGDREEKALQAQLKQIELLRSMAGDDPVALKQLAVQEDLVKRNIAMLNIQKTAQAITGKEFKGTSLAEVRVGVTEAKRDGSVREDNMGVASIFESIVSKMDNVGAGVQTADDIQAAATVQIEEGALTALTTEMGKIMSDSMAASLAISKELVTSLGDNSDITGLTSSLIESSNKNEKLQQQFLETQKNMLTAMKDAASSTDFGKDLDDAAGKLSGAATVLEKAAANLNGDSASGFVPNFAPVNPVSRALSTERGMGAKRPVVDSHPSVGTYVRDAATQPNFSAVRRDHPEGIHKATKNSRKMQNAAKGFVPNFYSAGDAVWDGLTSGFLGGPVGYGMGFMNKYLTDSDKEKLQEKARYGAQQALGKTDPNKTFNRVSDKYQPKNYGSFFAGGNYDIGEQADKLWSEDSVKLLVQQVKQVGIQGYESGAFETILTGGSSHVGALTNVLLATSPAAALGLKAAGVDVFEGGDSVVDSAKEERKRAKTAYFTQKLHEYYKEGSAQKLANSSPAQLGEIESGRYGMVKGFAAKARSSSTPRLPNWRGLDNFSNNFGKGQIELRNLLTNYFNPQDSRHDAILPAKGEGFRMVNMLTGAVKFSNAMESMGSPSGYSDLYDAIAGLGFRMNDPAINSVFGWDGADFDPADFVVKAKFAKKLGEIHSAGGHNKIGLPLSVELPDQNREGYKGMMASWGAETNDFKTFDAQQLDEIERLATEAEDEERKKSVDKGFDPEFADHMKTVREAARVGTHAIKYNTSLSQDEFSRYPAHVNPDGTSQGMAVKRVVNEKMSPEAFNKARSMVQSAMDAIKEGQWYDQLISLRQFSDPNGENPESGKSIVRGVGKGLEKLFMTSSRGLGGLFSTPMHAIQDLGMDSMRHYYTPGLKEALAYLDPSKYTEGITELKGAFSKKVSSAETESDDAVNSFLNEAGEGVSRKPEGQTEEMMAHLETLKNSGVPGQIGEAKKEALAKERLSKGAEHRDKLYLSLLGKQADVNKGDAARSGGFQASFQDRIKEIDKHIKFLTGQEQGGIPPLIAQYERLLKQNLNDTVRARYEEQKQALKEKLVFYQTSVDNARASLYFANPTKLFKTPNSKGSLLRGLYELPEDGYVQKFEDLQASFAAPDQSEDDAKIAEQMLAKFSDGPGGSEAMNIAAQIRDQNGNNQGQAFLNRIEAADFFSAKGIIEKAGLTTVGKINEDGTAEGAKEAVEKLKGDSDVLRDTLGAGSPAHYFMKQVLQTFDTTEKEALANKMVKRLSGMGIPIIDTDTHLFNKDFGFQLGKENFTVKMLEKSDASIGEEIGNIMKDKFLKGSKKRGFFRTLSDNASLLDVLRASTRGREEITTEYLQGFPAYQQFLVDNKQKPSWNGHVGVKQISEALFNNQDLGDEIKDKDKWQQKYGESLTDNNIKPLASIGVDGYGPFNPSDNYKNIKNTALNQFLQKEVKTKIPFSGGRKIMGSIDHALPPPDAPLNEFLTNTKNPFPELNQDVSAQAQKFIDALRIETTKGQDEEGQSNFSYFFPYGLGKNGAPKPSGETQLVDQFLKLASEAVNPANQKDKEQQDLIEEAKKANVAKKAGGFVPNFSKVAGEIAAAKTAGYKNPVTPSQVKSINIPGAGKSTFNTQESVFKAKGMSQPFIVPPSSSKAAGPYQKTVKKKFNFDPYKRSADGFVPNFAPSASDAILEAANIFGRFGESLTKSLSEIDFSKLSEASGALSNTAEEFSKQSSALETTVREMRRGSPESGTTTQTTEINFEPIDQAAATISKSFRELTEQLKKPISVDTENLEAASRGLQGLTITVDIPDVTVNVEGAGAAAEEIRNSVASEVRQKVEEAIRSSDIVSREDLNDALGI